MVNKNRNRVVSTTGISTNTPQLYLKQLKKVANPSTQKSKYYLINIHGQYNDQSNRIIFGFGDEKDTYYSFLEGIDEEVVLKNLKLNEYFNSDEYTRLRTYYNKPYEVFVIGHSCGRSDKTLLSELFGSHNCQRVYLFHHNGEASHSRTIREVGKHFQDKERMKAVLSHFEADRRCPQHNIDDIITTRMPY